jgi:TrmH family RNA methyltransferase
MDYRKITSLSNPQIKEAVTIREAGRKKGRSTFLIEGVHLIESAIRAGAEIDRVFFTGSFSAKREGQGILKTLAKTNRNVFEVAPRVLNKIADTDTPQGAVAIVTYFSPALATLQLEEPPLIVVADGIQDPGNLGTIIRTSDAAGAGGVLLLPGACDPFTSKTVRATAGSIFNIPVVQTDRQNLLEWIGKRKIHLAVTAADAPNSVFDADLGVPVALVFGNEARGVSESLRKAADLIVKIPVYGKAESLNVATSAAVCLYEAVRQRRKTSPAPAEPQPQ